MILLYIPLWIGAALLEAVVDGSFEATLGEFARWLGKHLPMRVMYGTDWRREARRQVEMRRLAANGGLLRLSLGNRFERSK